MSPARFSLPSSTFLLGTFILGVFLLAMAPAMAAVDPLSKGPIKLSARARAAARSAYKHALIMTDEDCYLKADQIEPTEIALSELPSNICDGKTKELIYRPSLTGLVACYENQAAFAMRVSIGTHGLGKTKAGNRKSPLGTYWLGHPRHSRHFGIFIPLGYPNTEDIAKGRTGSAIGIHGPLRFMTCVPKASLSKNWTAGCLAVGRDSQIIGLSEWIFEHWPVKITLTAN